MITFMFWVIFIGGLVWATVEHVTRKKTFMEQGGTKGQWRHLMKEEASHAWEEYEPESEAEQYYRRHNRDGT